MIKVDRIECPDILKTGLVPESEGEWESKDAISFFSIVNNHPLQYKRMGTSGVRTKESFIVYADKEVRKQLKKMSHGKCAYCESKITSIYSGDIEHFRPKGGYGERNPITKPGYYWLASDWNNLLFACPFCNQTNTHEVMDNKTISEVVQGKLNQFPLLTETYRLNYSHGNLFFTNPNKYKIAFELEETERLLLKPCTDTEIERYFEYDEIGLIKPSIGLNNFEETRAKTSIRVYALQRIGLVQSREEKVIQIKAQIRRVEEAMINLNNHIEDSNEKVTWFEGILRRELNILHEFKESNKEYAGLARFIIEEYFNNLS
jgi:uncharacterized protein (TIGR02646 family)